MDGSVLLYKNNLKLNTTQSLSQDTVIKVKDYLKSHLTNFKPQSNQHWSLIEQIRQQNAQIINSNKDQFNTKTLKKHEIIELKEKEARNKEIEKQLNMAILPNMDPNTKVFLNLDVQYDFIPWNQEYLRRMRLDFLGKKDKIVNFVHKTLTAWSHKQIFLKNSFLHDYQEWKAKIESNNNEETHHKQVERFDIWGNKKSKIVDKAGYEREAELFEQNRSEIPKANYNMYARKFFYVHKQSFKKIDDLIEYDNNYKQNDIWSLDDIALFIEKYLSYPKDFDQITTFFYNKTIRDIINFYSNFKIHLQLKTHAEELYGPRYVRKHISKKLEYISQVTTSILNKIDPNYYRSYQDYSQKHLKRNVAYFTTKQLMEVFSNLSSARKQNKPKKLEEMMNFLEDNQESKLESEEPLAEPMRINAVNDYFYQIQENGERIENLLLKQQNVLQRSIERQENQILECVPGIAIKMSSQRFDNKNLIPQRKIYNDIRLKQHEKKTQDIKIDEDDDIDPELELFHSRYQNSYLVVDK